MHLFLFFQAEDGIRDLVRSRGLGDVYKRQDDDSGAPSLLLAHFTGRPVVSYNREAPVIDPDYLSLIHI